MKRFKYYPNSQMIVDDLTGERYSGNKKTCDLLNMLDERANQRSEMLDPSVVLSRGNVKCMFRGSSMCKSGYNN